MLFGEGTGMPLEPAKLSGCGVGGLVPELDNGVSVGPCTRVTSPQDGSLKDFVAFTLFALVKTASDGEREEFAVLNGVGGVLRVGPVCARETDAATQVELKQTAICLEAGGRDVVKDARS